VKAYQTLDPVPPSRQDLSTLITSTDHDNSNINGENGSMSARNIEVSLEHDKSKLSLGARPSVSNVSSGGAVAVATGIVKTAGKASKSLHSGRRRQEEERIHADNLKLMARIVSKAPSVNLKEQRKDFQKHLAARQVLR
jgi:hypothetical protein